MNTMERQKRSYSMHEPVNRLNQTESNIPSSTAQGVLLNPDRHDPQTTGFSFPSVINEYPRPSNAAFYDERSTIFGEISKEQDERIRKASPYGHLKTWRLIKIIVKSNDDVRQEQFAMQLISQMDQIFKLKKLPLWLKPYEILATGQRCGLIECVSDALSID